MAPKRKSDAAKTGGDQSPVKKNESAKKAKKTLAIGDNVSAIDAVLMLENETTTKIADLCKDKGIIIFMYPRANTGGCTKQALGFKENIKAIEKAGYAVYGMSFDKPKSQTNWKNKYDLPYHFLTDEDGTALKAFGAFKLPKNVIRSHVVIAKGGKLVDIRNQISPGDSFTEAVNTVTGGK